MAFATGSVFVNANTGGFNRQVSGMQQKFRDAMEGMKTEAASFDARWEEATAGIKDTKRIISGILVSQAFYSLSNTLLDASAAAIQFSKDMETAAISMEYFVEGSNKAAKAAAFLREIKTFAARTPFSTQEALSLSKYMQAMGVGMQNTTSFLRVITDTASATGATEQNLQRIVFGLGQMMTKGRLANEEIRQLANANIPIYDILQEELGMTGDQIAKIGNYWIDADKAVVAILNGLEKRYKGAADRVSETITGMSDTLKDNTLIIFQEAGTNVYNSIEESMRKVRNLTDDYREIATELGSAGLFTKILEDIDQSGTVGTMVLSLIGNVRQLASALQEAFIAGKPFVELLGTAAYAEVSTFGYVLTTAARSLTYIVEGLDELGEHLGGVGDLAEKTTAGLASLFIVYKVAGAVSFLGQGLARAATGFTAFAGAAMGSVPGLAAASTGMKVATASAVGLASALFLIPNALSMLSNLSGLDMSGDDVLPNDYMTAYDEYKKAMEDYNAQIKQYQDSYDAPYDEIAGGTDAAVDGLNEVAKTSKKTAKSVKNDWVASFDEVYSIPKEALNGAENALPDFGSMIAPLKISFPALEQALMDKPTFDWDKVFSGSPLENQIKKGIDGSGLMAALTIMASAATLGFGNRFINAKNLNAGEKAAGSSNAKIFRSMDENLRELKDLNKKLDLATKTVDDDIKQFNKAMDSGDERTAKLFKTKLDDDVKTSEKVTESINKIRLALGRETISPDSILNGRAMLDIIKRSEIDDRLTEIAALIKDSGTNNIEGLLKEQTKLQKQLHDLEAEFNGSIIDKVSDLALAQGRLTDTLKGSKGLSNNAAGIFKYDVDTADAIKQALNEYSTAQKTLEKVLERTGTSGEFGTQELKLAATTQQLRDQLLKAVSSVDDLGASFNELDDIIRNGYVSSDPLAIGAIKDTFIDLDNTLRESTKWSDSYIKALRDITIENIEAADAKKAEAEAFKEARQAELDAKRIAEETARKEAAAAAAKNRQDVMNAKQAELLRSSGTGRPDSIAKEIERVSNKYIDASLALEDRLQRNTEAITRTKDLIADLNKGLEQAEKVAEQRSKDMLAAPKGRNLSDEQKAANAELRRLLKEAEGAVKNYGISIDKQVEELGKLESADLDIKAAITKAHNAHAEYIKSSTREIDTLYEAIKNTAYGRATDLDVSKYGVKQTINADNVDEGLRKLADTLGVTVDELVASGTKMMKLSEGVGSFGGDIPSMLASIFGPDSKLASLLEVEPTDFSKNIMALGNELESVIVGLAKEQLDATEFGQLYKGINAALEDAMRVQIDSILSNGVSVMPVDIKTIGDSAFKNIIDTGTEYIAGISKIAASKFKSLKPEYYMQFAAQAMATGSNQVGMTMFNRDYNFEDVKPGIAQRLAQALGLSGGESGKIGGRVFNPRALEIFQNKTKLPAGADLIQEYMKRVVFPLFTNSVTKETDLTPLRKAMHTVFIEYPKTELEKLELVFKSSKWNDLLALAGTVTDTDNVEKFFKSYVEIDTALGKRVASLNMAQTMRTYTRMEDSPSKWLSSIMGSKETIKSGSISKSFSSYVDSLVEEFQKTGDIAKFEQAINDVMDAMESFRTDGKVPDKLKGLFDSMKKTDSESFIKVVNGLQKLANTPRMLEQLPRTMRTVLDMTRHINEAVDLGTDISGAYLKGLSINLNKVVGDLGIATSETARNTFAQLEDMYQKAMRSGGKTVFADKVNLPFRTLGIEDTLSYIAGELEETYKAGGLKIVQGMNKDFERIMKRINNKKMLKDYLQELAGYTQNYLKNIIVDLETVGKIANGVMPPISQVSALNPANGERYDAFINRGPEENRRILEAMQNLRDEKTGELIDVAKAWLNVSIDDLNNGKDMNTVLKDLQKFVGDNLVTGYNAGNFDIRILNETIGSAIFKAGADIMDTVQQKFGTNFGEKLTTIYERVTGMAPDASHLSTVDVDMTYEIAKAIDNGTIDRISKLANEIKKAISLEGTDTKYTRIQYLDKSADLLREYDGDIETIMTRLTDETSSFASDIAASMSTINKFKTDKKSTMADAAAQAAEEIKKEAEAAAKTVEAAVEGVTKNLEEVEKLFARMDELLTGGTFEDLKIASGILNTFGTAVENNAVKFSRLITSYGSITKETDRVFTEVADEVASKTGKNAEKIKEALQKALGDDVITAPIDLVTKNMLQTLRNTLGNKLYKQYAESFGTLINDVVTQSVDKFSTQSYDTLNIAADKISEEAVKPLDDILERAATETASKIGGKIGAKVSDVILGNATTNVGVLDIAGLAVEGLLISKKIQDENKGIAQALERQAGNDRDLAGALEVLKQNGSSISNLDDINKAAYGELWSDVGLTIGSAGASAIVAGIAGTAAWPAALAAFAVAGGGSILRDVTGGNTDANLKTDAWAEAMANDTYYKQAISQGMTDSQARALSDSVYKIMADKILPGVNSGFWTNDDLKTVVYGSIDSISELKDQTSGTANRMLRLQQALGEVEKFDLSAYGGAKDIVDYQRRTYGADSDITLYQTENVEALKMALDYVYKQGNQNTELGKTINDLFNTKQEKELINKYYGAYIDAYDVAGTFLEGINAQKGTSYEMSDFQGSSMESLLDTIINYAKDMEAGYRNLLSVDDTTADSTGLPTYTGLLSTWNNNDGNMADDYAGIALLDAVNKMPEQVSTALSEIYGIKVGTSTKDYTTTSGDVISQAFGTVSLDINKLKDELQGWTMNLPDNINLDVAQLSSKDVEILAQAGIQINGDGTVTFMKAANANASGTERTVELKSADISGAIAEALRIKGLEFDFSGAETKLNLDMPQLSGEMKRALFKISDDIAGGTSDAMNKAMSGIGTILDSGYLQITNKSILSGKQTVRGYLESMGYEFDSSGKYIQGKTDVLSEEIVNALLQIDTEVGPAAQRTAESVANAAEAIVIESPIKAEELTPEIRAEFEKVGVSFIEEQGKFYALISNPSENAAKGITIIPEETWNLLNENVKTNLKKLGVTWTTELGLVTVNIGDTVDTGVNNLVKLFVEQPEVWDQIPAALLSVFQQAGLVAENGMLVINTKTLQGMVPIGDSWYQFWDQLPDDVIAAMGASKIATDDGIMKITQAADTDEVGVAADGSIVIPFSKLPKSIQDSMGDVSDEIKKGNLKIVPATKAAFLGVEDAVKEGMNPAVVAARKAGGDIAAAVAAAIVEAQKLANVKVGTSWFTSTEAAPSATKGSNGLWTVKAGGYSYKNIEAKNNAEAIEYAKEIARNRGNYWPAGYAVGGIVGDGWYRAGEFGKKEGIIPLENKASLGIIGATIARSMLTNPMITGMYNGGVDPRRSIPGQQVMPNASDIAKDVLEYMLPALYDREDNGRTPVFVGTLIADDRGIRELEQRMYDIRKFEDIRR